jgi:hypothetical protein
MNKAWDDSVTKVQEIKYVKGLKKAGQKSGSQGLRNEIICR